MPTALSNFVFHHQQQIMRICCAVIFLTVCFPYCVQSNVFITKSGSLHAADWSDRRNRNHQLSVMKLRGGFAPTPVHTDSEECAEQTLEVVGSPIRIIEGTYSRTSDLNGRWHYEKSLSDGKKIHLYWSGTQWLVHYDTDPSQNFENMLAYAKARVMDPRETTTFWTVKIGKVFQPSPSLTVSKPGASTANPISPGHEKRRISQAEFLGVPSILFPLYIAFMLDAIAVGLAMPLLPFYVMELGANAFQLSLVISANYAAQTVGCIVMGNVSDMYGRRLVLLMCLAASSLSYFCVSRAHTLVGVALARVISGSFGGLVPVMQSCVADVAAADDRPKYLGRIMATFGAGFVLGPALSAMLPGLSTRQKIRLAGLLPLSGLCIAALFFKETKKFAPVGKTDSKDDLNSLTKTNAVKLNKGFMSIEVMLLVLNGFLLMYAFATESIYAMFIKDSFGYGERALSTVFAVNGLFIGIFQVFLIKPMVTLMGKHATLAAGNILLAAGMVGVALVRKQAIHFLLFTSHIVGYSIADTAVASLISRYASPESQGRDLALNQAAQSCARVLSPMVAGLLYEHSKVGVLPVGALPFLAGALFPAFGVAIPSLLYIWNINKKRIHVVDNGE